MDDKPLTLDSVAQAVMDLAEEVGALRRKLRKQKRKCDRCRRERAPRVGFRLGDDASVEQDPEED